ncbi:hypothetical protein AB0B66_28685 [Catellatospora sp. NPDC049111]|uniref:hypothetical protein n=1 Tax=Catellatospora sp. NPDC049111 TaxID=3155271 RepID=UPI0033E2B80D
MSQDVRERLAAPSAEAPPRPLAQAFDPQDLVATIPARWHRARWFWLFGALAAVALVLVNVYQDTIGSASDFQLGDDLRRIFSFPGVPDSAPAFPLVRDVPSWLLLVTISVSLVLLRHEWNRMRRCLPDLVRAGVLQPRPVHFRDGVVDAARTYGKPRLIPQWLFSAQDRTPGPTLGPAIEENSLTAFLGAVRARARAVRSSVTVVIILASVLLAFGLVQWQRDGGLFSKIVPPGLSGEQRERWLQATYADWWASDERLWGNALYFLVAFVAFAVVLSFITGGVYAIYVAAGLKHACRQRADWAGEDRDFGWEPLGKVYRTVWQALLLLSFAIAVIGSVLGFTLSSPVGFLIWVSIVSVPLFLIVPGVIFRNAAQQAKDAEAKPLREALTIITGQLEQMRASAQPEAERAAQEVKYQADRRVLLDQLDRIYAAHIRPLRVMPRIILVVLIPQTLVVLGLVFGAIQAFK